MVESSVTARTSRLDGVFHALSDTTRRSILRHVATGQKTVGEIALPFSISLAAVSKHLKVLEKAQLIHREKKGSFGIVRINAAPMKEAERWLAFYEKFWTQRLDALADFLEHEQPNQTL